MPASKNTSIARGRECERIARRHFEKLGYLFITRNLQVYHTEVDLLLISPEGELVVVEVKSNHENRAWKSPVGRSQTQRLIKVFQHLVATSERPVRLHFAAVDHDHKVQVFQDFLSDVVR